MQITDTEFQQFHAYHTHLDHMADLLERPDTEAKDTVYDVNLQMSQRTGIINHDQCTSATMNRKRVWHNERAP